MDQTTDVLRDAQHFGSPRKLSDSGINNTVRHVFTN